MNIHGSAIDNRWGEIVYTQVEYRAQFLRREETIDGDDGFGKEEIVIITRRVSVVVVTDEVGCNQEQTWLFVKRKKRQHNPVDFLVPLLPENVCVLHVCLYRTSIWDCRQIWVGWPPRFQKKQKRAKKNEKQNVY